MSIKQLQSYIGQVNIAGEIDDDVLTSIGQRVFRQYEQDLDTMTDWMESVENGIRLMQQEWHPKSTPWEGASNYKDPLLTQASIQFGDKATLELLRAPDLVATDVIGRDIKGEKKEIAKRVSEAMNYQVNYDMGGWRRDQERLFYTLPNVGCVFKKLVYDPIEGTAYSHIIQYPDFVVNQATKNMDECRSFSQVLDFSRDEVNQRVKSGRWIEADLYSEIKDSDKRGDEGSNEDQDVQFAMDNDQAFIEQQTFYDIDDDGYEEPYTVTIHKASQKVVRIVARFDDKSIKVKYQDKMMELPKALKLRAEEELQQFGGAEAVALLGMDTPEVDPDELELMKIVPFQHIVKYGFIPAPDGTFLDLGYSHLLGPMTQALNTTTNQLIDRGTLNNVGGGFLSKEFRKEMGVTRLRIGQYVKTDVPADKMANGVFPNPVQEPSQTLFALNEKMDAKGNQFLAVADNSGKIQGNTAPTTALAIIQEGMIPTTALFKRIIEAESDEFRILFRINQRTFDQEKYAMILDGDQAIAEQDFNVDGMDIFPTANAEMSSRTQRIQTAGIQLEQVPMVLQAGGNPVPIIKNFFDAIGSELLDQIFPEEGSMSPAEQEQIKKMTQAQEQANQIQQMQLQILQREQDRLDAETQADIQKIAQEIKNMQAELIETLAKASKYGEEAESESLNNRLNQYTANMQMYIDRLTAIGAIPNAGLITQSPQQLTAPNQQGVIQ